MMMCTYMGLLKISVKESSDVRDINYCLKKNIKN
jgi:hypothetical protein